MKRDFLGNFTASADLIKKVYTLTRPYGRKKLILIIILSFTQGVFQVIGVTSVFPFLALASDPDRLHQSQFGGVLLGAIPEMENKTLLISAGVFAITMILLANCVNLFTEYARTRYANGFGHWLRIDLMRSIASRSYTNIIRTNSGVLIKKVAGDVAQFSTGVLLPLLDSFARLAAIVLLVATLFLVHAQIAIIVTLVFGLFYLLVFRSFGKWRRNAVESLKEANRGVVGDVQLMLTGIKPVKVHCAEEFFVKRFEKHSRSQAHLMSWNAIITNSPRYLVEPIAFGGVIAVILFYISTDQDFSSILPNLGVMALAGYRLLPAVQLFYGQVNQLSTMRHALDEIFDEYLAAEKISERDPADQGDHFSVPSPIQWEKSITLDELSFQYPGTERPIFENLNLIIPKNTSLGITGTTGSGKSTLVDILLGLHSPASGSLLLDDTPISQENRRAWRMNVGYVPQDIYLIDDSVKANIAFGIAPEKVNDHQIISAAKAAQIYDFVEDELPSQWDTIVGERGVLLSGGQRQRIGLARALYSNPDVLILDEATSALDTETESAVMKALERLQGEKTLIIIAHRISTVKNCTHRLDLSPNYQSS